MKVVVTGGTGFIGRPLVRELLAAGHSVAILSRSERPDLPAGTRSMRWPAGDPGRAVGGEGDWVEALGGTDAVVQLAGEPIAARRWSPSQKARILQSRVGGTRTLVAAMERQDRRPGVLICASAVGYYGPRGDEELTEQAAPGGDFLSRVCVAWEAEARRAEALGTRVALLRTGLVLAGDGGALPRMLLPFRLFVGGPLGSGRQWVPWIHRDDLVGLILHLIARSDATGPVNGVGPNPVRNRQFARTIGRVLRRPSRIPAPAPLLRLALGEMAGALLLSGQRAVPARALRLGYRFRYPDLEPALGEALLGSRGLA